MPLQATSGAASYDAFGGGVPVVPNYIEDVFSSYLWTGNDSSQTITNGIDLAGKGGLVWIKSRNQTYSHILSDTNRGTGKFLSSNTTDAQGTDAQDVTAFNTTGFTVGNNSRVNNSSFNYVGWTFRKQPKFFDVVTLTADGSGNATFSHNLGATPGCVILKRTNGVSSWVVWHRGLTSTNFSINLNTTSAQADNGFAWITPGSSTVSINGGYLGPSTQWVAYLFAHNAGGFGLTGTDNVISCGSLVASGGANDINLGFETQFILLKKSNGVDDWYIFDTMRGMPVGNSGAPALEPNLSAAEANQLSVWPTATGFATNGLSGTYIYIAIRRGPMRTPTTGTSVFTPVAYTGNGSSQTITAGFPIDLSMFRIRGSIGQTLVDDRLRGAPQRLFTDSTAAETTSASAVTSLASNTGVTVGTNGDTNSNAAAYVNWSFRRASSYFDVVCYTASGVNPTNISHNLAAAPELMIIKKRSAADTWTVYAAVLGANKEASLNNSGTPTTNANVWNNTAPTATVFTVGLSGAVNESGQTYVAYLFATCPGVSKVGSYTGTGATQTINCGFTGGARFVLIKRTNNVGDWRVWDTARGMVAGTDPRLALNLTDAELNNNWVYTTASGFQIVTSDTSVNASGSTYLFLAIA